MRTTKRQQHPHKTISRCPAAPQPLLHLLGSPCSTLLGRSGSKLLGRPGGEVLLPGLRSFPLGGVEALDHPGAVAAVRGVQHGQVCRDVQYEEVNKQVGDFVTDAA